MEPLRFLITAVGLSPSPTVFNRAYQGLVLAALLAAPILLFVIGLNKYESRLTESTLVGAAILALIPVISHLMVMPYLARNYIADEVHVCLAADPSARKKIMALGTAHAWGGLVIGTTFAVLWQVNLFRALKDGRDWARDSSGLKTLFVLQAVAVSVSVASFTMALVLYSLVCNIIRMQAGTFSTGIKSGKYANEAIVYGHHHIKTSVAVTNQMFSRWIFPAIVVTLFSISFQTVGYFHQDKHSSQYNGAYYIIVPAFLLVFLIVVASTVTGKIDRLKYNVGALLSSDYTRAGTLSHVLAYLQNVDDSFKIFGVAITSSLSHLIVFAAIASVGAFVWEGIH
ncbi:uncharacterized protein AMSG_05888 [Thecamonas trahens ATCC 50062]|uniref:Uncharacterized protein n=1 Tax=Thecamonas trahens ATCC 50062 TaxID=461836 RepID=A0A0L0DD38_THETB|nr:hypothetical protein AMSG_05888 [Thecamonas trahens ATCC 50062]KNC50115.1 hypothetical protein AMSG_05888 [Thecamonas trahens ATCC 50062]|eukprot:XP_013757274.1 hypothetical protein AMSG_05888 [Thecamonas trahens ATCC 50062]